ncbi:hypothetical protein [Methanococcoides sp. FTZ1]|uniref:hypothetical protein n=1 Tax=Methanococcoides sp. FTZ1 TaxID=3439061 RepID=UPI003F8271E0
MRYYVWIEEDQSLQACGKPYALFRVEIGTQRIITDWWNPDGDFWEHHPGLASVGDGNVNNIYHEIDGEDVGSIKKTISKGWNIELN